jgi:hypothetical protein
MIRAYDRLRQEARELHEREGWPAEEFDREVPAPEYEPAPVVGRAPGAYTTEESYWLVNMAGPKARFLLQQLAAWASAHVEVFEIEARMRAEKEVEARLRAEKEAEAEQARKRKAGF